MAVDVGCVSALALLDQPQADVGCDPVQPGSERRIRLEAIDAAPGAQHRLLERVVGVVQRAEHAVAVQMQRLAVRRGQLHERLLVTRAGAGQQPRLPRRLSAGRQPTGSATGSGPARSVQAEGAKVPGTPPSAMKRMPSSPGTIRRLCSGPTRTIIPGSST